MEDPQYSMRSKIWEELDFLASIGTKLFLYPFIGKGKIQKVGYTAACFVVTLTSFQLFLTLFSMGSNDWLGIINVAPNLGVCAVTLIKYSKIHTNKESYDEIYQHFRHDIWNIISPNSTAHRKIVQKYKKITMFVNRFLLYYSVPLTLVIDSIPYLFMMFDSKILGKEAEHLFPFDGWYPFDKVKWYAIAYLWESFMTGVVIFVYGFSNMLHATYVSFICMELKILGNCIEELITAEDLEKIMKHTNAEQTQERARENLKYIISRHSYLAKVSADLDRILGDAMLLNYSLGAVFICLTAFTFTVVDDLYKSLRYFFMFTALLVETFSQCIIGQILSDHSENLTESIYSSDWPNVDIRTKKIMLMLIMRAQKPFKITAHGYLPMNLNTFSRICSTSYQFFNLLRTIYPTSSKK